MVQKKIPFVPLKGVWLGIIRARTSDIHRSIIIIIISGRAINSRGSI
jgi:hypothetical protein